MTAMSVCMAMAAPCIAMPAADDSSTKPYKPPKNRRIEFRDKVDTWEIPAEGECSRHPGSSRREHGKSVLIDDAFRQASRIAHASARRSAIDLANGIFDTGEKDDEVWVGEPRSKSEGPRLTPVVWTKSRALIYEPSTVNPLSQWGLVDMLKPKTLTRDDGLAKLSLEWEKYHHYGLVPKPYKKERMSAVPSPRVKSCIKANPAYTELIPLEGSFR